MNDFIHHQVSNSAAGTLVFALGAAMATGQVTWPVREAPLYIVPQTGPSYSPFIERSVFLVPNSGSAVFAREIANVYAVLSEGQEPLGAEFEAVWDANVECLYEG